MTADDTTQFQLNLAPARKVWSVSELTGRIRDLLAGAFADLWVEGEVSNCHVSQPGHIYFTLKDAKTQIRCVAFRNQVNRLKFRPEDGLKVTVRGSIGVYEPRGEYQFYVEHIEPVGLGALQLAFEQMKKRLEAEGLFDAARKKPLPALPRRVGLITSPRGAAVRDIIRILRRRFPNLNLLVYPVRVQGEDAPAEIAAAIKYFDRKRSADVILLARGGGSLEDLWAFNEEIVARAIAGCAIPIISGVGHETDFTIADFVADVRASTPSAAAELVVLSRQEFDRHLRELRGNLADKMRLILHEQRHRLQELITHAGFRRLEELLRQNRQRADELLQRLGDALETRLELVRRRFTIAQTRIASFDLRQRIQSMRLRIGQRSEELRRRVERLLAAKRQRLEPLSAQRLGDDLESQLKLVRRRFTIAQTRIASFDLRQRIQSMRLRIGQRAEELRRRVERLLAAKRQRIERLGVQLEERSPLRVLERGYAIAYDAAGNVLRSPDQVALGDEVRVQLARGRLSTEVKAKPRGGS